MKMKMVKKLVAMALVSTMALSGLAACETQKKKNLQQTQVKKKAKIMERAEKNRL